MAELKRVESDCHELLVAYVSLHRQDPDNFLALELDSKAALNDEDIVTFSSSRDPEQVLTALENLQSKLIELEPKTKKFRQRLQEKDPITGAPRYGEKTAGRVQAVLELYEALIKVTHHAFGSTSNTSDTDSTCVVTRLREQIAAQKAQQLAADQAAQNELEAQQAQERAAQERQRHEQEQQRLQALEQQQLQEADLARRAQASRDATRQAQEAAAQAERDWIASIPKGPEGVRQQIRKLKESTRDDLQAQSTALTALLTLFTQIAQHPEEINFRKIRRNHPKFHQDIGRHAGGQEVLIAAGFQLKTMDEVPCFFSKEPDLETDMDGWSAWFDNLKANLEVVKQEQ